MPKAHASARRRAKVEEVAVVDPTPFVRSDQDALDGLRAELRQEHDRHLRARADFENYRRRIERDGQESARQAKRPLLLALLELADGFERALAHIGGSPDSVAAGFGGMQRQLSRLLDAELVRPFDSVGQRFEPTRHEAVAIVAGSGHPPGTIVDEAGRGYLWSGELLRPARVRVAV